MNAPTFLDFLSESQHSLMSGWINIYNDKHFSDVDKGHGKIIGMHWKDFGFTEAEVMDMVKQPGVNISDIPANTIMDRINHSFDGHYGRFYSGGWIRYFLFQQHTEVIMECTSSEDVIREGKDHIMKLANQAKPTGVLLSNAWDDLDRQPGSFMVSLNGEDVMQGNYDV